MRPLAPQGLSRGSVSSRPSVRPCSDRRAAGPARDASTLVARPSTAAATRPVKPGADPPPPAGGRVLLERVAGSPESVAGSPESVAGCRRNAWPGQVGTGGRVPSEYAAPAGGEEKRQQQGRKRGPAHGERGYRSSHPETTGAGAGDVPGEHALAVGVEVSARLSSLVPSLPVPAWSPRLVHQTVLAWSPSGEPSARVCAAILRRDGLFSVDRRPCSRRPDRSPAGAARGGPARRGRT